MVNLLQGYFSAELSFRRIGGNRGPLVVENIRREEPGTGGGMTERSRQSASNLKCSGLPRAVKHQRLVRPGIVASAVIGRRPGPVCAGAPARLFYRAAARLFPGVPRVFPAFAVPPRVCFAAPPCGCVPAPPCGCVIGGCRTYSVPGVRHPRRSFLRCGCRGMRRVVIWIAHPPW